MRDYTTTINFLMLLHKLNVKSAKKVTYHDEIANFIQRIYKKMAIKWQWSLIFNGR